MLIPKTWWHDCEHNDSHIESSDSVISMEHHDCSICLNDFKFDRYDFVSYNFNFVKSKVQATIKGYTSIFINTFEVSALRGPPMK